MKRNLTLAFALILLLLVTNVASAETTNPKATIEVAKDGRFTTIQGAIAAAHPGDTIIIKPGTYYERIIVDKPVKILGEKSPVIDGGGQGDVITLLADHITLQGLVVTNGGYDLSKDQAGIKIKSNHNVICSNKVIENSWGIYLYAASNNEISHNFIKGRAKLPQSNRGNGIHLWSSNYNILEKNELVANRDAMYFSFANHNIIKNNLAYNQRYGIHYMYSNYNKLENNTLRDNIGGIAMMVSNHNKVAYNKTYNNSHDGMLFKDLDDNVFTANISYNNRQGIYMYNSNRNKITGNVLAANLTGLNISAGSDNNNFTKNSWVQNIKQVVLTDPLNNHWDDGDMGNYWSDYSGYDLDNNGIGDEPYIQSQLVEYLVNKSPLIKLLFNSPAIAAVKAAEKAFPVLHPAGVMDKHPLMKTLQDYTDLKINWDMKFKVDQSEDENNFVDEDHRMSEDKQQNESMSTNDPMKMDDMQM